MRKYIFLMVGLLSLFITGCGNGKAQTNENVSTVEVIKPDASYGEDMVNIMFITEVGLIGVIIA